MNIQEDRVSNYRSLSNFPNHEEALHLLKKLASHVKPIMEKRNWRVHSLEEFLPADRGLLGLNVNHGEKICIRLRPYYDERRFYDFNDLIGTMLHELTHIQAGPHDATFYKLLDELNDDYDDLLAKGYNFDGPDGSFYGNGYRLGQGISLNISPALARQRALEAAEKRRKIEGLMTQGGRKLGGGVGGERYGLSLRELTALAAERRQRDNFWCGSGHTNNNDYNNNSNNNNYNNNDNYPGRIPSNKFPGLSNVNNSSTTSRSSPIRIPTEKIPGMKDSWKNAKWTCLKCTFINRPMTLQCYVCLNERPNEDNTSPPLPQPVITIIDDFSGPFQWDCPRCTFKNAPDIIMCLGCDYLKN